MSAKIPEQLKMYREYMVELGKLVVKNGEHPKGGRPLSKLGTVYTDKAKKDGKTDSDKIYESALDIAKNDTVIQEVFDQFVGIKPTRKIKSSESMSHAESGDEDDKSKIKKSIHSKTPVKKSNSKEKSDIKSKTKPDIKSKTKSDVKSKTKSDVKSDIKVVSKKKTLTKKI